MTAAYQQLFPDAPTLGLVDVTSRRCWAKPPLSPSLHSASSFVLHYHDGGMGGPDVQERRIRQL
jgi:hypothetical protein